MKPESTVFEMPLAREILGYMIRNPQANDTCEGIVEWWLREQKIRHSVADAKAALAEFVAQRLVLTRQGVDGRTHYRLNPKMKAAIGKHLSGPLPQSATGPKRRKHRKH